MAGCGKAATEAASAADDTVKPPPTRGAAGGIAVSDASFSGRSPRPDL